MLFLLCKLSNVTKFSKAAVHIKKATLTGTLTFQMFFQGKYWASVVLHFPHSELVTITNVDFKQLST